jgi:hypothetical protein
VSPDLAAALKEKQGSRARQDLDLKERLDFKERLVPVVDLKVKLVFKEKRD